MKTAAGACWVWRCDWWGLLRPFGRWYELGVNVNWEFEWPDDGAVLALGGVEDAIGFESHWKGRRMLINAQRACVPGSCWAWSRKYRWQL